MSVLILSRHAEAYRALVETARLPGVSVASTTGAASLPTDTAAIDIVFGEPSLIRDALARLPGLKWVQST